MEKPITYLDTILNLLYTGERVRITFPSSQERETFRKRLYARKCQQDEAMIELVGEERKVLRMWRPVAGKDFGLHYKDDEIFEAEFYLEPFKAKVFPFEIIKQENQQEGQGQQEESEAEGDETIPTNLASSPSIPK